MRIVVVFFLSPTNKYLLHTAVILFMPRTQFEIHFNSKKADILASLGSFLDFYVMIINDDFGR